MDRRRTTHTEETQRNSVRYSKHVRVRYRFMKAAAFRQAGEWREDAACMKDNNTITGRKEKM